MFLVLGKTGYVGSKFVQRFTSSKQPHIGLSRSEVDYTDMNEFDKYIKAGLNGTYYNLRNCAGVINCAGYIGKPNVDACEHAKQETLEGNSILPMQLALTCKKYNIPFAHISSGCIFNGYDKHYNENDAPDFAFENGSWYSASKMLGEKLIAKNNRESFIFRLRIPFDHVSNPRNYITKMLTYDKLLDMENSMSNLDDFVFMVWSIMTANWSGINTYGIWNITNPGSITTRRVTELINQYVDPDKKFEFYTDVNEFAGDTVAPRSNCALDTTKLETFAQKHQLGIPTVEQRFIDVLKKYK